LGPGALLFVPGVIWGLSFIVVELVLRVLPPVTVTLLRSIISAVVLFVMLKKAQGYLPKNWWEWWPFFILAALNQAVPFALSSWSQIYIEAGLASILLSVMPIFTVLLAAYFMKDEPLSWTKLLGAGLGFMGIIVLMGPAALKGLGVNFLAQLAVIISAILYAFGAVYARAVRSRCSLHDHLPDSSGWGDRRECSFGRTHKSAYDSGTAADFCWYCCDQ
jgi:drug/metabolite transporter (DMT)-like permease